MVKKAAKIPAKTTTALDKSKRFWRTKYPWTFVIYILAFGVMIGGIKQSQPSLDSALDIITIAMFTTFVFCYVFYIYGVRPDELEHKFKK